MAKILTFEQSEIMQLAIRYTKARGQRRAATDDMRKLKAELHKRGFDEHGVAYRVRAELRKKRAAKQQFHDDGEGNKHSGSRGDCGRCQ